MTYKNAYRDYQHDVILLYRRKDLYKWLEKLHF